MRRPFVWMTLAYIMGEAIYRLWGAGGGTRFSCVIGIAIILYYAMILSVLIFSGEYASCKLLKLLHAEHILQANPQPNPKGNHIWLKYLQSSAISSKKIKYRVLLLFKDPVLYILPLIIVFGSVCCASAMKPHPLEVEFSAPKEVTVQGKCSKVAMKAQSVRYQLEDCIWIGKDGFHKLGSVSLSFPKEQAAGQAEQILEVGSIVRVQGTLSVPERASNRGQFDQKEYYLAQEIHFVMKGKQAEVLSDGRDFLGKALFHLRIRIKHVYQESMSESEAGVLSAMVLGDKEYLSKEINELYQNAGISHILAISGLHVSMLGMFFFGALKRVCRRRELPAGATVAFLFAYGILTGFSISTSRAVWMLVLSLLAGVIGRTYDRISALAFVAFLILLLHPLQLFQCGFQLSFGAVLSITVILPALEACLKGRKERKEGNGIRHNLQESFLVSVSIFLGTFPCLAYFYYETAPYSTLLNLLVLPLASLLLLSAACGGVLGCIWLPAGKWVLLLPRLILWFYQLLCRINRFLPGHVLVTGKPRFSQIAAYLIGIALFLALAHRIRYRALPIAVALIFIFQMNLYPEGLLVSVLDVGQGDCIFIKTPAKVTVLIDGGSSSVSGAGEYRLEPFLKSYRCRRLDYVILSHLDNDHINAVKELLELECANPGEHIRISNLILGKSVEGEEKAEELVSLVKGTGGSVYYFNAGSRLEENTIMLSCLHPEADFISGDANSASLVMELKTGDFSMLFTGDLDDEGENALLKSGRLSEAPYDVLKVGHHGSKYSSSQAFLDKVRPALAVVSYGKTNRYGHPHKETLERLKSCGSVILSTGENGEIDLIRCEPYLYLRQYMNEGIKSYGSP